MGHLTQLPITPWHPHFPRTAMRGALAAILLCAAGCAGPFGSSGPSTPPPPLGQVLPVGYRAVHVWTAKLSGESVPETIVSSIGPPVGQYGFHSMDLQVLSWDSSAQYWAVIWDGQKVGQPYAFSTNADPGDVYQSSPSRSTPLLDPAASVTMGQVLFAHVIPGAGEQMIFSEYANYGGSGEPGNLDVVDFHGGVSNLAFAWEGNGGVGPIHVKGDRVITSAEFWTPVNADCCPARRYTFVAEAEHGQYATRSLDEVSDQRPWLGVEVQQIGGFTPAAKLKVVGVVAGSPAATRLRIGDVLLSVRNAPSTQSTLIGSRIIEEIDSLNAGQTANLLIRRGGRRLRVRIHLGSLNDPSVTDATPPSGNSPNVLF